MPRRLKRLISHAPTWMKCPASERYRVDFPQEWRASEVRDQGIAAAWCAEVILKGERTRAEVLGTLGPEAQVITDELLAEVVDPYVEYVRGLTAGFSMHSAFRLNVELSMRIDALSWAPYSKPDLWFLDPTSGVCHIIDLKGGWVPVDSEGNWQLAGYAIGIRPLVDQACMQLGIEFAGFRASIYQPRVSRAGAGGWAIPPAQVRHLAEALEQGSRAAMSAAPRESSGTHCTYCPGLHVCPTARKASRVILDYGGEFRPGEATVESLEFEYAALSAGIKVSEGRRDAVKHRLEVEARAGRSLRYTMQESFGNRAWSCKPSEVFMLGDLSGVDLRGDPKTVTPAEAERRGIPAAAIDSLTKKPSRGFKLKEVDQNLGRKLFGDKR